MRMRNKPWARPELEACSYFIGEPSEMKGKWLERFPKQQPVHIELGCGKGVFAAESGTANPGINYIAMDIEYKMLGVARRKISAMYEEKGMQVDNLLLTVCNIERISEIFLPDERIADRIYINFCNPWPRNKHKKHRLTHPRQLEQYKAIMKPGAQIRFKTDDDGLFDDSLEYFAECGFKITYLTRDLHKEDFPENIMTEHEKMFSDEEIPIKFLIAEVEGH